MKQVLCLALMLALCIFSGVAEDAVEAEQSEALSSIESDATYDGQWQPFEDGFMLYLPRGWAAVELTGAQQAAGLFYRANSADGAMSVAVGYMPAGGLATPEDLALDFEGVGYSNVALLDLNGIPAISFERPQDNYRGVAFFHPVYPQYVLYVYVLPLAPGDGESRRMGEDLLASIGPVVISREMLKNN